MAALIVLCNLSFVAQLGELQRNVRVTPLASLGQVHSGELLALQETDIDLLEDLS